MSLSGHFEELFSTIVLNCFRQVNTIGETRQEPIANVAKDFKISYEQRQQITAQMQQVIQAGRGRQKPFFK